MSPAANQCIAGMLQGGLNGQTTPKAKRIEPVVEQE